MKHTSENVTGTLVVLAVNIRRPSGFAAAVRRTVALVSVLDRPGPPEIATRRSRPDLVVLVAVIVAAALAHPLATRWLRQAAVRNWATVFVAIATQATPFLVLGVVVSGLLAALLPPQALARLLPRSPLLAVPMAAVAGAALPGCECGSVPIARRLIARGAPPATALTFLLAAPAINPVVLVATAVAFPGRPVMVLARLLASLLAAIVVGLVWAAKGDDALVASVRHDDGRVASRWSTFVDTAQHDFLHAGGFLVIGAAGAAALQTVVPRRIVDSLAGSGAVSVLALATLAVLLAICSEADAFVAASLTQFSLAARLAFLTVGPMVDLKLIALQAGTFGRRFTVRFAPLTFVVALGSAALVGWWLL